VEEVQSTVHFAANETMPLCPEVLRCFALYRCAHVPADVDGIHLFSTLFSPEFPYLTRLDTFTANTAEARHGTTISVAIYPQLL
jgi:hypothetical protein